MAEKRFWSGAILAVTIVIAGASSLPALLLGPTAREPMPGADRDAPGPYEVGLAFRSPTAVPVVSERFSLQPAG